jgi:hypothetical protein
VRERQGVADDAGRRHDLARDQSDEDQRQDDEQRDEDGGSGLAGDGAEQHTEGAEARPGERETSREQRKAAPRLAADDVAELHREAERERDREAEHERHDDGERDLRRHELSG